MQPEEEQGRKVEPPLLAVMLVHLPLLTTAVHLTSYTVLNDLIKHELS